MEPDTFNAALSDAEIEELDHFLLYEAAVDDSMPLDMLDGYLHALAVGPTPVPPNRWMPRIWGEESADMLPPVKDVRKLGRIVGLITRLYNSIAANLEDPEGAMIVPLWSTFRDGDTEREDAEIWACGFIAGMDLCEQDWAPLLATEQGREWLRPIRLLGEEDFAPEQEALTGSPAAREKLSMAIPAAVLAMYAYWLPRRAAADTD